MAMYEDNKKYSMCVISAKDAEDWVQYVSKNLPGKCINKYISQVLMMPTVDDMNDLGTSSATLIFITEELLYFLKENKSADFNSHVTDTRKGILYFLFTCEDDIVNNYLQNRFPNLKNGAWLKLEFHQFSHNDDIQKNWLKILRLINNSETDHTTKLNTCIITENNDYCSMDPFKQNKEKQDETYVQMNDQKDIDSYAISGAIGELKLEQSKDIATKQQKQLYLQIRDTENHDGYLQPVKPNPIYENYRQSKLLLPEGTYSYVKVPFPTEEHVYDYADLEPLPNVWSRSQLQLENKQLQNKQSKENTQKDTKYEKGQQIPVTVLDSEASQRCKLVKTAMYYLQVNSLDIQLYDYKHMLLWTWPIIFLRRYGRAKKTFTFEGGRRCSSGPGVFTFSVDRAEELFTLVERIQKEIQSRKK